MHGRSATITGSAPCRATTSKRDVPRSQGVPRETSEASATSQVERIGLAGGCFDLVHVGHIHHLRQARERCDRLVVAVTSDRHVAKGLGRPVFNESERCAWVAALPMVDGAFINDSPDAASVIAWLRPAVYFKGPDYRDVSGAAKEALDRELAALKHHGGDFHVTDGETCSSTRLIDRIRRSIGNGK